MPNTLIDAFRQKLIEMGNNETRLGSGEKPAPISPPYIRPEVNLSPIDIIKSFISSGQQSQSQMPQQSQVQVPQQPQMPTPPINIASPMQNVGVQNPRPQGNGINWQMLADIGIPALSALVGTVAPGTLAGAAGFSSGYTGAREKQREITREDEKENKTRNIKIFDEDTGEIIDSGQVMKATDEILKKSKTKEDFRDSLIKSIFGMQDTGTVSDPLKTNKTLEFKSIEEAENAKLPVGTKITVNGKPATIQ